MFANEVRESRNSIKGNNLPALDETGMLNVIKSYFCMIVDMNIWLFLILFFFLVDLESEMKFLFIHLSKIQDCSYS